MAYSLLIILRDMAVENLQRDWYVVYSNPHKEEQAQFHLALKGVKSFFPKLHIPLPKIKAGFGRFFPITYLFAFTWKLNVTVLCGLLGSKRL